MKKFIAMAFIAVSLVACNNEADNDADDTNDTAVVVDNDGLNNDAATAPVADSYTPVDGDVTYTEKKVRVRRNNQWEDANDDVKLDNGVIIYRDGRAMRDGNEVELEDGVVVDRSGNVFDRTGHAMEDAWDATKHGAKKAGKAVGNAAEKVGEKAKDIVD